MAKRATNPGDGELGFEESQVESFYPEVFVEVEAPAISLRSLVLLQDVHLKINGPVTGQLYEFPGSGSVLLVDSRDAEIMLQKTQKSSCCGSEPGRYFQEL